jgi:hypothetical protein
LDIPVKYTTSQKSRHNVGLQVEVATHIFDRKAANCLLAAKKIKVHDPRLVYVYYNTLYRLRFAAAMHAQSCSQAWHPLDFLHFISMPNKTWF